MAITNHDKNYRRIEPSSLDSVRAHLAASVIGQRALVDSMLICLISEN